MAKSVLDGDFFDELAALQQGWTDPELQRALQGSYSHPKRQYPLLKRAGIDSAANIGSVTADGGQGTRLARNRD